MKYRLIWPMAAFLLLIVLVSCNRVSQSENEPVFLPAIDVPAGKGKTMDPTPVQEKAVPTGEIKTPDSSPTAVLSTPVLEKNRVSIDSLTPTPAQPDTSVQLYEEENMVNDTEFRSAITPSLRSPLELAKEDLSQRLDIGEDEIEVLETRTVVWPDASLGCPQPGKVYAQSQMDGLLIRLGAKGQMYFYHSGGTREPFLCKETAQVVPNVTPKFDEFVPPPGSEID